MNFTKTPFEGVYVITLEPYTDDRGFFARGFCKREFKKYDLKTEIIQCNISYNYKRGTLRGMHYQVEPMAEVKMVRCDYGAIFDVIIDIRPMSKTYLNWFGIEINAKNHNMVYIPEGFAHGFQALDDNSEVFYMTTQFYSPEHERAIRWNDPTFSIQWPLENPILSNKDANHPDFIV